MSIVFSQFLKEDFLSFLDEWETEGRTVPGLGKADRGKLCLSKATLDGLRMTGMEQCTDKCTSSDIYQEGQMAELTENHLSYIATLHYPSLCKEPSKF